MPQKDPTIYGPPTKARKSRGRYALIHPSPWRTKVPLSITALVLLLQYLVVTYRLISGRIKADSLMDFLQVLR